MIREVDRISIDEYDKNNLGKTEKDKDDERRFKQQLSSYQGTTPFYLLDTNDQTEYWRYLYEFNKSERKFDGLLNFVERFYRDYAVTELNGDAIQEITVKIRNRILNMANQIYAFIEVHE